MKPQKALWSPLATLVIILALTVPFRADEIVFQCKSAPRSMESKKIQKSTAEQNQKTNMALPVSLPQRQNKPKTDDKTDHHNDQHVKTRHHDEEKHNNHVYDYSRLKHKRKTITAMFGFSAKILVAISYIAVLLSSYGGFAH